MIEDEKPGFQFFPGLAVDPLEQRVHFRIKPGINGIFIHQDTVTKVDIVLVLLEQQDFFAVFIRYMPDLGQAGK